MKDMLICMCLCLIMAGCATTSQTGISDSSRSASTFAQRERQKMKRAAALRAQYPQGLPAGKPAEGWGGEACKWVSERDVAELEGPFVFVDSAGCHHLLAIGICPLAKPNDARSAEGRAMFEAKAALFRAAGNAAVVEKNSGTSSELRVSGSGVLKGVMQLRAWEADLQGVGPCRVVLCGMDRVSKLETPSK